MFISPCRPSSPSLPVSRRWTKSRRSPPPPVKRPCPEGWPCPTHRPHSPGPTPASPRPLALTHSCPCASGRPPGALSSQSAAACRPHRARPPPPSPPLAALGEGASRLLSPGLAQGLALSLAVSERVLLKPLPPVSRSPETTLWRPYRRRLAPAVEEDKERERPRREARQRRGRLRACSPRGSRPREPGPHRRKPTPASRPSPVWPAQGTTRGWNTMQR